MKKCFLSLLVLLILLVGGCGSMSKKPYDELMLEYINNKYDDSFSFVNYAGGSMGSNVVGIIVSSEKYPDTHTLIRQITYGENVSYADNYLGIKYETETRERLTAIINDMYGSNVYLNYSRDLNAYTENGSSSTSLEQYMSDKSSGIQFTAWIISESGLDQKEVEKQIKKEFAGIASNGYIYFITDASVDNIDKFMDEYETRKKEGKYNQRVRFTSDGNGGFSLIEWKEGE